MRILYSHRTKSADGQYVHIRALTGALDRLGHGMTIVGPEGVGASARRTLDAEPGASGWRARLPGLITEPAEMLYSAPAYARLARAADACAPDVLYERYNLYFHAGAHLARARRLPFILEVNAPLYEERLRHGGLSLGALARWSEASIWRAADAVLPVTAVLAAKIAAAGVPPERLHVVPNGVDADFMTPADPRPVRARHGLDGRLVLGFTGFVRPWHGVDRIVRFLKVCQRTDVHLLLVGDGDARADLEQLAADLGVADRLTVTGVVQREAVAAHVAAFDIALQPAVVDYASPLKLFEYMAQGRAIVAPANANIREVLTDGEDAFLFAPDDEAALHARLAALVESPDLRQRLGGRARATLEARDYTWAGNARRVTRLADHLLASRQPARNK